MPYKTVSLPPKRVKNIIGEKFGRLTVIAFSHSAKGKQTSWTCSCSCGNTTIVRTGSLRSGGTKSCGCGHYKHGHATTECSSVEYGCWSAMKQRCYNKKAPVFKNYGGRGITVCKEWLDSFEAFYKHVGPKPSPELSLDRIDNDGNYEPGNCRWATRSQQQGNKRLKTHCLRGHEFTKTNTTIGLTKHRIERVCRACNRDRCQKWRREQKPKETQR